MVAQTSIFRIPAQITIGRGSADSVGMEAKRLGGTNVFVISDPALQSLGITDQIVASLKAQGLGTAVYAAIAPEPVIDSVGPCLAAALASGCNLVVGVGGGSALDTGKAIAMLLGNGGSVRDYLGVGVVPKRGVPSIMIPTTAGTGAEVTPNALFQVPELQDKRAVVSPYIIPDVAIIDPLLTLSVPPKVTASTGMDALCHAIESYTSVKASVLTEPYSLEAIRLIGNNLRIVVADGSNLEAREAMAKGSLLAGISIASAGTNAVHALAYPVQGRYHVPHGIANSLLLPYVMVFNCLGDLDKFPRVAEALGETTIGMTVLAAAEKSAEACRVLADDIGIPKHLSDVGLTPGDIDALAEGAMQQTRLLDNNPRPVRPEDARAIFEKAM